jgi:ribonucleoside-diphosphate reductase alpha chain
MGITNPHSDYTHAQKYRDEGEDHHGSVVRWATGLADDPTHRKKLIQIGDDLRFMPAGRIQAAIGSSKNITPYNCYVSGTIHDSFVHGHDMLGKQSIMGIAMEAATTMRMGGGIGYDWSTLRPSNDLIEGVQATTDGPIAFMPINDAVCRATSSSGNRRGAQMGVMRIDHPDIRKFLYAKQPGADLQPLWDMVENMPGDDPRRADLAMALQSTLPLTGFNLSIAVTDQFMECLLHDKPFELTWGGKVYDTIDPKELWDEVMESTWHWAEPGVLFIDTINKMNNLWYCETIAATNPCGEQPLPPYGACLLGS